MRESRRRFEGQTEKNQESQGVYSRLIKAAISTTDHHVEAQYARRG